MDLNFIFIVNGTTNYQTKINVNYTISDPTLIGKTINAIMKAPRMEPC